MTEKEMFKRRDVADMTRLQCLYDWADLCKVILSPECILKEDIDVYKQELDVLTTVIKKLLIAAESNVTDQTKNRKQASIV